MAATRITRYHARKGQQITVRLNDGTTVNGTLETWDRIAIRIRTGQGTVEHSAARVWHAEA